MQMKSTILQHVSDVEVKPLTEGSTAFAFRFDPPGVFILDAVAWTTYEYCAGRTPQDVENLFLQAAGGDRSPAEVEGLAKATLDRLLGNGLIEARIGGLKASEPSSRSDGPMPHRRMNTYER